VSTDSHSSSYPPSAGGRPWIVGLDLGERSLGALVVGHWLGEGEDGTVGVYVLEAWIRPYIADGLVPAVERVVTRAAAQQGVPPPARVTVLETGHAEDGLARAAEGAAGLVIGRAARTGGAPLVRLGHVARRLLRMLPGPVVVAPRDLTAVPPGPILLATDLGDATAAALPFAERLAERHGRPLELVHVGEAHNGELLDEQGLDWTAYREETRARVERAFETWAREHHLGRVPRHVAYGDPAAKIAEIAAERRAALVVVGSRRLGTAARMFLGSTASTLAGAADCPVAVVPPA
jgi:nucleotide-binding universal stress UspA family protein